MHSCIDNRGERDEDRWLVVHLLPKVACTICLWPAMPTKSTFGMHGISASAFHLGIDHIEGRYI